MTCLADPVAESNGRSLVSPRDMVHSGLCIGCGSCVTLANCSKAEMRLDRYGQFKPSGPDGWQRRRTVEFSKACPFSPRSADEEELAGGLFPSAPMQDEMIGRFEGSYVGHVAEEDFRASGSSGGMVSWVACELLRKGLVDGVAHVAVAAPSANGPGFFRYVISRNEEQVRAGAKSRYYPVELSGVIEMIRTAPGKYAVVGIPCFIKALQLLRSQDPLLRERIVFTLGLFCGHMKSARMVESFAWQMGTDVTAVEAVEYRLKKPDRPANWYTAQLTLEDGTKRSKDWWHLADGDWGAGFFQNSACNFCDDVVAETADISFGDAWVEPYSSDGRGTNVVIVRAPALHELLRSAMDDGRLSMKAVDAAFIQQTQAAGFRQRREGLAFRLSWPRLGIKPRKRVAARWRGLPVRRKLIYAMRYQISRWSHRMFWLARLMRLPALYIGWARGALTVYHGLAYSRGKVGRFVDRLKLRGGEG